MAARVKDIDSDPAIAGGNKVLDATRAASTEMAAAIARIRELVDSKPAGGGEEGERFDTSHEAVVTALDAADKLRELIQEMAENVVNGATSDVADDLIAAQILNAAAVHDIPDFKF
jgi:hypothetical protein